MIEDLSRSAERGALMLSSEGYVATSTSTATATDAYYAVDAAPGHVADAFVATATSSTFEISMNNTRPPRKIIQSSPQSVVDPLPEAAASAT